MRLYGVTRDEVLAIVSPANRDGEDRHGNPRYVGSTQGRSVCVIRAHDDLTTVITVYDLET